MQTYSSRRARMRRVPPHPEWLQRVADLREAPRDRKIRYYETHCPYCDQDGCLEGSVKVGSKEVRTVKLLADGPDVPDANGRPVQIQIGICKNCKSDVDPFAYESPIVFLNQWEEMQAVLTQYNL